MKQFQTLLLSCFYLLGMSQTNTYSLQLFYEINEVASAKNFKRLDSFCTSLPVKPGGFRIRGYADFLYDNSYNQQLSQKRSELIKDHLMKMRFNVLSCEGFGEIASQDNGLKGGDPLQRRVDLVMTTEEKENASEGTSEKEPRKTTSPVRAVQPPIKLAELKKGESLTLEGLGFVPGRHIVLKKCLPILENLLETLTDHPTVKIEIQGHVCCVFDTSDAYDHDALDYKLSEHRAKTVYTYLVDHGISSDRLTYRGYGHSRPKVKELNPDLEQMNRRVEIRIVDK